MNLEQPRQIKGGRNGAQSCCELVMLARMHIRQDERRP